VRAFEAQGRIPRRPLPVGLSAPPHRAGGGDRRARVLDVRRHFAAGARAGHATLAEAPAPSVTAQTRKKASTRGCTGQALASLVSAHPTLDLSHVSARQLAGFSLDEHMKVPVAYGNLSPTDGQRMAAEGTVAPWVPARARRGRQDPRRWRQCLVDLSADYGFENSFRSQRPVNIERL
jgi:N-acetyl-gamma-glutamyl-phosphate reductase/acetylglutamate kinase